MLYLLKKFEKGLYLKMLCIEFEELFVKEPEIVLLYQEQKLDDYSYLESKTFSTKFFLNSSKQYTRYKKQLKFKFVLRLQ